jgi:hypothetical protein
MLELNRWVNMTEQELCEGKQSSRDLTPSHKTFVYRHVMLTTAGCLIAENCLQSQSYLKCQDDFRSTFLEYQVPDKSTVFRSMAHFRETGSLGD